MIPKIQPRLSLNSPKQVTSQHSYKLTSHFNGPNLHLQLQVNINNKSSIIKKTYHSEIEQYWLEKDQKLSKYFKNLQQLNESLKIIQNIEINVDKKCMKIIVRPEQDNQNKVEIGRIWFSQNTVKIQQSLSNSSKIQKSDNYQNTQTVDQKKNINQKQFTNQLSNQQTNFILKTMFNRILKIQKKINVINQKVKIQSELEVRQQLFQAKQQLRKLKNTVQNIELKVDTLNNLYINKIQELTNTIIEQNKKSTTKQNNSKIYQNQQQEEINFTTSKDIQKLDFYQRDSYCGKNRQSLIQPNKSIKNEQIYQRPHQAIDNSIQIFSKDDHKVNKKQVCVKNELYQNINKNKQRIYYKIKDILKQRQQYQSEIPFFIDRSSAYSCCFSFHKNTITLIYRPKQTQIRIIMLLGNQPISQKNRFTFKIIKSVNKSPIGFGIVDRKLRNRKYCRAGQNAVKINIKGVILDGSKTIRQDFDFCKSGSIVEMKIYQQFGIVQWIFNNNKSYSITNQKIKDQSITWVPFIQMKNIGDTIQWVS